MEKQLCHACSDVSISQIKEENEKDQGNFLAYVEAYEARLYYLSYSTRKEYTLFAKNLKLLKEQQEPTAMQLLDILFPRNNSRNYWHSNQYILQLFC